LVVVVVVLVLVRAVVVVAAAVVVASSLPCEEDGAADAVAATAIAVVVKVVAGATEVRGMKAPSGATAPCAVAVVVVMLLEQRTPTLEEEWVISALVDALVCDEEEWELPRADARVQTSVPPRR
jgi:hypothetical protein